ncbi:hypothetical protein [Defluviimonas sp. WL0075]|uniref:Uncharacterized protein n=1 Tax=Albidovulum sediminicola TaxID=2984331 RepID=A0ABT2YZT0_9RHOB|nr:hypothetical protein [Defluviimonas sp. WL0075]MCV2864386.1 hypothetical protein [Defluviimonas sp. WL0075]
MTPETNKLTNVADKIKTVNAAWDKAPSGTKKDAALKHRQADETAQNANDAADAHNSLDAAPHALA